MRGSVLLLGMPLSLEAITKILDSHNIASYIANDHIFAANDYISKDGNYISGWIDLTGISLSQLKEWLGY